MEKAEIIRRIKDQCSIGQIREIISKFKGIKTLVIGEAIIDEYHFASSKGRATKDPILSVDYINHEVYAGGILAIANHVSNFVDNLTVVTLIGDKEDRKDFISRSLNKNIALNAFVKENSPTIIKKRYLDAQRNTKLFKVEHINDSPINEALEGEIVSFLELELPKYDLVIVGDFGHGFITERIIKVLEEKSKFLAVNAQCNSANLGYNFVTKYNRADFLTMDNQELWYAVSDRFSEVPVLINKLHKKKNFNRFLVTLSKSGSVYFDNGNQIFFPAFVMNPRDTVGAGDAVFSLTSLFAYTGNNDMIPFIANCAGGIAVSYMGNKEFITKEKLIDFIEHVYNGDLKIR